MRKLNSEIVKSLQGQQTISSVGAVIKELLENAIDAIKERNSENSNRIIIQLKNYGLDSIMVSDDGTGIHKNSHNTLIKQNTTSKISSLEDLQSLNTFGFRGTALASICNVSGDFRIITRTDDNTTASELIYSRDLKLLDSKPVAREIGTTVVVSKLFDSLPVRRKVLEKNIKNEFQKALKLIQAYAIVSTNLKMSLTNEINGKRQTLFSTRGSSMQDNLVRVFGAQQVSKMDKILFQHSNYLNEFSISLEGFITKAKSQHGRSQNDRQFIFLNNRPVDLPKITKSIHELYKQYNMHQVPAYALNLQMDSNLIDINVSSDKRLVFIKDEDSIIDIIREKLEVLWKENENQFTIHESIQLTLTEQGYHSNIEDSSQSEISSLSDQLTTDTIQDSSSLSENKALSILDQNSIHSLKRKYISNSDSQERKRRTIEHCTECSSETGISEDNLMDDLSTITNTTTNYFQQIYDNDLVKKSSQSILEEYIHDSQKDEKPYLQKKYNNLLEKNNVFNKGKTHSSKYNKNFANRNQTFVLETDDTSFLNMYQNMIHNIQNRSIENSKTKIKENFESNIQDSLTPECEEELNRLVKKSHFEEMRIIGQFNKGFIITEHEKDLFIIDQHASDEKYNFELLQKITVINSQPLIAPKLLDVSTDEIKIVKENEDIFKKCGFGFNYSPEMDKLHLTRVPHSKNITLTEDDFQDLLSKIQQLTENQLKSIEIRSSIRPTKIRSMFASRACRSSVMIGSSLSHKEMKRVVSQLGQIEKPWNCPHGRPTLRHLSRI